MTKQLRAPTKKPIVLPPIFPNVGIEVVYRTALLALVKSMHKAMTVDILRVMAGGTDTDIVGDASLADVMNSAMRRMAKTWLKRFDTGAQELADWFAKTNKARTDGSMSRILKDAGFTVEFKMTPNMRNTYDAVIHEQVGLIKSIASEHLADVQTAVMQSVQQGRKLSELSRTLEDKYEVTSRRAALIARDQNNKATATLARARRADLGITHAKWRHSAAGKTPRPSHVEANGKIYEIQKGMYLDGVWTWPGHEINCRCSDQAVIPGFED